MEQFPLELVSEIFIHSLPIPTRYYYGYYDDPAPMHSKICSVSRLWNQIAISTPELWTYIKFDVARNSHSVMKRRTDLSKSRPLDIAISLEGPEDWDDEDLNPGKERLLEQDAFKAVRDEAWRWNSLKVEGFLFAPIELRLWVPQFLPMLSELSLSAGCVEPSEGIEESKLFFSVPQLTCCFTDQPSLLALIQNCNTLRSLTLQGPELRELIPFYAPLVPEQLPELQNLESITFSGESFHDSHNQEDMVGEGTKGSGQVSLRLPSLKVIEFTKTTYAPIRAIFGKLDAPNLETVIFRRIKMDSSDDENSSSDENSGIRLPALTTAPSGKPVNAVHIVDMELGEVYKLITDIPSHTSHTLRVEFSTIKMYVRLFPLGNIENSEERELVCTYWDWIVGNVPKLAWVVSGRELKGADGKSPPSSDDVMKIC
ncbi:hypothetical protein FRC04_002088 [Tulasnella sp. 424]|nr:hypothetical protein FRC04_002088 [Tulasnella sp. 424]KAG8967996.1 hypothetical protein FRC05_001706 [Tulasnella sp. 425]